MDRTGRTHAPYRQGKAQLAFGEDASGRIVHVSTVAIGSACGCVCPACGAPLVARQGTRVRHFAHKVDTACAAARETMLHRLAKQILQDSKWLHLPIVAAESNGVRRVAHRAMDFTFDAVELEVRIGEVIPDIVLRKGGRQLFVEIWVTHACDAEKLEKLRTTNVSTLEIDLRKTPRFATLAEVEEAVLRAAPREWLVNPRLDAAMEQVKAVLVASEAAQAEKLDRQAAQLAAAWDHRQDAAFDDERHLPLVREARRIEALGYLDFIGLPTKADRAFTAEPLLWQAWLFRTCLLSRPSWCAGEAGATVRGALASMRRDRLVAPLFAEDIESEVLSRLRRLRPQLRTPADLIQAYFQHLAKAGLAVNDGGRWCPSDATQEAIDTQVEAVKATAQRRDSLIGRAESLLRRANIEDGVFDLTVWVETAPVGGGLALARIAKEGGTRWDEFQNALSALERAFCRDGEIPDCLGLPLAGAITAAAEARREAALRRQREEEARALAAAQARGASLAKRAMELLGPEAPAWIEAYCRSDGLSRREAAQSSEAVYDQLRLALEKAGADRAARLDRERRAAAAREDLKQRSSALLGVDRAAVFMAATHPAISARPINYCVDDRTLTTCLNLLRPGPGRRR